MVSVPDLQPWKSSGVLELHRDSAGGQAHAMAWRYIKTGICGTAAANRRAKDEIQAAAILALLGGQTKRRWGGSVIGHAVKNREREEIFAQIMRDYFVESPLYGDDLFRRR